MLLISDSYHSKLLELIDRWKLKVREIPTQSFYPEHKLDLLQEKLFDLSSLQDIIHMNETPLNCTSYNRNQLEQQDLWINWKYCCVSIASLLYSISIKQICNKN
jgi:hypothetical protein